jgi:hypothetical protein
VSSGPTDSRRSRIARVAAGRREEAAERRELMLRDRRSWRMGIGMAALLAVLGLALFYHGVPR